MTENPFRIEGPAMVSFSGGRTSAYMLFKIVEAFDGVLPDDIHVNFANTGKEREETLRFVYECGSRWGVKINWIEWRREEPGFELVGFNSASRAGEPFQALIDFKQRLPNWKERWCTQYLKVLPMTAFAESLGFQAGGYGEVIGLRYDEGARVLKSLYNAEHVKKGKVFIPRDPPRKVLFPLSRARVRKADVMAFWKAQPFDLGLQPWEGNCDLCFLKGRAIKKRIIARHPNLAPWWANNETGKGSGRKGWFDKRDSIAGLVAEVRRSPDLYEETDFSEYDTECGLHCGGDA